MKIIDQQKKTCPNIVLVFLISHVHSASYMQACKSNVRRSSQAGVKLHYLSHVYLLGPREQAGNQFRLPNDKAVCIWLM